jgi:hypothetical protein
MRCALGLLLRRGMGFILGLYSWGFSHETPWPLCTFFLVIRNAHTFRIFLTPPPPRPCHAHTAADFVKCASYCFIFFYKFRYIDYIFS